MSACIPHGVPVLGRSLIERVLRQRGLHLLLAGGLLAHAALEAALRGVQGHRLLPRLELQRMDAFLLRECNIWIGVAVLWARAAHFGDGRAYGKRPGLGLHSQRLAAHHHAALPLHA